MVEKEYIGDKRNLDAKRDRALNTLTASVMNLMDFITVERMQTFRVRSRFNL